MRMLIEAFDSIDRSAVPDSVDFARKAAHPL
jgi:hypothetical protein